MNHSFQVTITESHLRMATRRFLMRHLGLPGLAFLIFSLALFVYMLLSSQTDWLFGLVGGSLLLYILTPLVTYFVEFRNAKLTMEKLGDGVVDYAVDDKSLRQSHSVSTTEIRADAIRAIWKFPEVWLLLFRGQRGYLVLPVTQLSHETQAALQRMVLSAGGRVDGVK